MRRSMRLPLLLLLMVSVITPSVYGQGSLDAIADGLTDIDYDFGRWPYPLYAEVTARLQELAAQVVVENLMAQQPQVRVEQ